MPIGVAYRPVGFALNTIEAIVGNLERVYQDRELYGTVPSADDADELARNLIDVDDALALNTIKTLKASDEVGDLISQSGDQVETAAESAAPGSAPFLRLPAWRRTSRARP